MLEFPARMCSTVRWSCGCPGLTISMRSSSRMLRIASPAALRVRGACSAARPPRIYRCGGGGGGAYAGSIEYAGGADSAQNGAVMMATAPSARPPMMVPGRHKPSWPLWCPPGQLPPAQAGLGSIVPKSTRTTARRQHEKRRPSGEDRRLIFSRLPRDHPTFGTPVPEGPLLV